MDENVSRQAGNGGARSNRCFGRKTDRAPVVCECGDHAWIVLTQGYVALIDPEDAQQASRYSWSAKDYGPGLVYARRGMTRPYTLHNFITGQIWLDHINGNPLDNRRRNLRTATPSENNFNRRNHRGSRSAYKGVDWHMGAWRARIGARGKRYNLGYFPTEEDAREAYQLAAESLHGDYRKREEAGQ